MTVRHAIMQVNYYVRIRTVFEDDVDALTVAGGERRWVPLGEAGGMALTGLARKVLTRSHLLAAAPLDAIAPAGGRTYSERFVSQTALLNRAFSRIPAGACRINIYAGILPRRLGLPLAAAHRATQSPKSNSPQGGTMASKASAVWTGSLKEGKGTISTATGVLKNANYSFATRFEGAAAGTTPEELIAAAHASCFSMALGAQLGDGGTDARQRSKPMRRLRWARSRADSPSPASR